MSPSTIKFSSRDSQLRKHYFLDRYVVIAPGRSQRPDSFKTAALPHVVPSDHCPFDNNIEPAVWQHPQGKNWRIKVVRNAFPALTLNNPSAFGVQEVIINTQRHDIEFSDLAIAEMVELFTAYRSRLASLSKIDGIRYVAIFKNDGPLAGASIAHAHCQVYALPIIPPQVAEEAEALNEFWDRTNTCAHCGVIDWETKQKVRVIAEDKNFIAIAPYASSHAYEAWLLPRRHIGKLGDLHSTEIISLVTILKKIAARLDSEQISFNYFLQESLDNQDHHFVLKVQPRAVPFAGAELSTGMIINPVAPEYATLWYRGKV